MESHTAQETIIQNIGTIQIELAKYAMDPENPPMLLPVTKTQPVERVKTLREAGVTAIGENRVQEILEKYPDISTDFAIHLIGQLQTNKIKYIIGKVCMVQSLDRLALAHSLHQRAEAAGTQMPVLVEVNIGREPQKAGVAPEDAEGFIREAAKLSGLHIEGLMTVMPYVDDPETVRPLFRQMRTLFERLRETAIEGAQMRTLSMGMSGDWRVAAQEGSTLVRIGSAVFGPRAMPVALR